MLLSTKVQLEDLIIQVLALKPGQSAKEIHELLIKAKNSYNLSSVYQELRKLKSLGILVHKNNAYQLRLGWVNDLSKLFREVERNYLKPENLKHLFPDESEKMQIQFKDLRSLCVYWGQMIIALGMNSKSKKLYEWAPYCWFDYSGVVEEKQFREILVKNKIKYYLIIGNESPINQGVKDSLKDIPGGVSDAVTGFLTLEDTYYSVTDPYIITVEISSKIHNRISKLMESKQDVNNFDRLRTNFGKILDEEGKCILRIENNSAKVKKLTSKFDKFFGF